MNYDERDAAADPQSSNLTPDGQAGPYMPRSPEGSNRRNFIKAAVVASATVAAAGAAGAAMASGRAPTPLLSFIGAVPSGSCIPLKQGGKFGGNNPNNFLQVDNSYLSNFGTASSTKDGNGNYPLTFTHCSPSHTITFTLTDKNHSDMVIHGQLVETGGQGGNYSYEDGNNTVLYLAFTNVSGTPASLNNEFPTGSCLTLSCS